jgi:2-keto-4-pentenoate hydratase/2-oxohepta-3-ene-1,7-dioic acid hydratase in catechol pathway
VPDRLASGDRTPADGRAEVITLEPGDLVLTGTPEGVGEARTPPTFLQPGDVVRVEVEGLGAIEHPITAA